MLSVNNKQQKPTGSTKIDSTRSFSEVASYLAQLNPVSFEPKAVERLSLLDQLCGKPSETMDIILVTGTNSVEMSLNLTDKLLVQEGFKVGIFNPKNILCYNEQILINGEQIPSKVFASVASKIIDLVESRKIVVTAYELLIAISLMCFKAEGIEVALIGTSLHGKNDAAFALPAKIVAITKVTQGLNGEINEIAVDQAALSGVSLARKGTTLVCAEQSKILLGKMKDLAEANGVIWPMPVRKLSPLPYIYEQLYGKIASLAERIAVTFCEEIKGKFSPFLKGNLLSLRQGQRGRPTLEAKREAERNPVQTIREFWDLKFKLGRGQFELIENEKPSILLDNSDELDGLNNLFLGIRLLNYKKPIVGLSIILTLKKEVDADECLKSLRYLFKKVTGEVFFIVLPEETYHKPHELAQKCRELGIRANVCQSLKHAFDTAKVIVDSRDGLVCIAGSNQTISDYWRGIREIKKF